MVTHTNHLIEFATNNRTTTHFRDTAILEIRVAYRIMEYLAPDETFPPKVNTLTKNLILKGEFENAYEHILQEIDKLGLITDLGCSQACKKLEADAIALMERLLPVYEQNCKDTREKRKIELLRELKELGDN